MITIRENICDKLPGITSLFITFPFNQEIINLVKNCDVYRFNKKTKEWELPINSLSYILDNLTYYDDIELNLYPEKEALNREPVLLDFYKLKPFDYQLDGIKYGLSKDTGWLLLDAPGLGKTAQIIHLAEELKVQEGIEHCFIICGLATLKSNWRSEIGKHSTLSATILGERTSRRGTTSIGTIAERVEHLNRKIDEFFIITNIETLRNEDIVKAVNKGVNKIDMIVVDEIHKAKSSQSAQGDSLLKLKNAKYKIGLTGTLLMNNPLDAYVPLTWIGSNRSALTEFKNFYCVFSDRMVGQVIGAKNTDVLKYHINKVSLRRTKDLLNLPPKTIINEYVDLNDKHAKFYQDVKAGIKRDIDKVKLTTKSILAMTTRLRQATVSPSILSTSNIKSSKIERAIELAEQIISNGDKVVIFSTFREPLDIIYTALEEHHPVVLTGDTKESDIEIIKETFQCSDNCKAFLGTWQKAGTGITLTAARYMIFLDTPWTNADYEQAQDRIHRIGTKESVFIYNLICKNTIDERVNEIVSTKQVISDYIIDDIITQSGLTRLQEYLTHEI